MAAILPQSLQIPNRFHSTLISLPPIRKPHRSKPQPPRAASGEPDPPPAETDPPAKADPSFENRLSQIRLKYRSGTGKKAEQRRAKKSDSGKKKNGGGGVLLPPVPLRDPLSNSGLKVEFGFSPYSERINGRIAAIGLAALLLVELGSGKRILAYHAPPIIFLQLYTVAALSAVFIKYEKERISVWPPEKSSASAD